jgi:hypothetical protein
VFQLCSDWSGRISIEHTILHQGLLNLGVQLALYVFEKALFSFTNGSFETCDRFVDKLAWSGSRIDIALRFVEALKLDNGLVRLRIGD